MLAARVSTSTILIGFLPARGRGVTLEKAAINAVMAGCRPEYFPVVVAALEAMFDAGVQPRTRCSTSTGGAALCVDRQRADRAGDRDERAPQRARPGQPRER